MKYKLSDKIIAYLTLISGLVISAVAVWYSVAGLVSIFAAAALPIMIMGVALEVSKLVATVWLKWNWQRAPLAIKSYLITAITVLMLITSMGIFGYLSKAHLDQAVPTGDVADKVALIDEKIKTEKENVDAARRALKQMDDAVDQTMSRSDSEQGAQRAVQIRRNQQAERSRLQKDIATAQSNIAKLNEERAPIAKELRKVEAEVGPIKYIAALIYGDNPDANLLEAAVRWVIIVIVLVFDPLAVVLLLASQYSFQWFRQEQETPQEEKQQVIEPPSPEPGEPESSPKLWPFKVSKKSDHDLIDEANAKLAEIENEVDIETTLASVEEVTEKVDPQSIEGITIDQWNQMISEAEKAVEEEKEHEDHEIIESAADTEKKAMKQWKHDNPEGSLKLQKKLLAKGVIDKLPWEKYLEATPDFDNSEDEAAIEAAKWAAEQLDSKKKDSDMDRARGQGTNQEIQGDLGYVQNAEQNGDTLWKRVKEAKKDL